MTLEELADESMRQHPNAKQSLAWLSEQIRADSSLTDLAIEKLTMSEMLKAVKRNMDEYSEGILDRWPAVGIDARCIGDCAAEDVLKLITIAEENKRDLEIDSAFYQKILLATLPAKPRKKRSPQSLESKSYHER